MSAERSQASGQDKLPPEYVDPYVRWVYGAGRRYAQSIIKDSDSVLFSALGEWPEAFPASGGSFGLAAAESRLWFPSIWDPADGTCHRFLPFAFTTGQTAPEAGPDAIEPVLREICAATFLPAATGRPTGRTTDGAAGGRQDGARNASFRLNFPIPENTFDPDFVDPDFVETQTARARKPSRRKAIIAVIDDGLAFANANLCDTAGKTRVEHCWIQDARSKRDGSLLFGREVTGEEIDALLERFGGDEDAVYRHVLGEPSPYGEAAETADQFASHGSLVLDIAAGRRGAGDDGDDWDDWDDRDDRDDRDDIDAVGIIAVQLPRHVTANTAGFGKEFYVLAAMHYIFCKAREIGGGGDALPLIVNFSYGYTGGPHDGSSQMEIAMDALVEARRDAGGPTAVVMPAGNSFLSALAGRIDNDMFEGDAFPIPWRVQPNDRTSSYLEMWFPDGVAFKDFDVRLFDPRGREAYFNPGRQPDETAQTGGDPQDWEEIRPGNGDVLGQFSVDRFRRLGRWRALVVLIPSEPDTPGLPAAEAGLWTIELRKKPGRAFDGAIECRIQRDIDLSGYRRGARQSYFDDWRDRPVSERGDLSQQDVPGAFVRRFASLNGSANGRTTLAVAGYRASDGTPAVYSSAGPETEINGRKPEVDCSAPSERGVLTGGIRAAGTRSGSTAVLTGTSAAAPAVTRHLALAFVRSPGRGPLGGLPGPASRRRPRGCARRGTSPVRAEARRRGVLRHGAPGNGDRLFARYSSRHCRPDP